MSRCWQCGPRQRIGLDIPRDDLSVVGFDDSDFALYRETPLTTVAQDIYGIGKCSVEFLIDRMEGYRGPRRWERLPVELRVRGTTEQDDLFEVLMCCNRTNDRPNAMKGGGVQAE